MKKSIKNIITILTLLISLFTVLFFGYSNKNKIEAASYTYNFGFQYNGFSPSVENGLPTDQLMNSGDVISFKFGWNLDKISIYMDGVLVNTWTNNNSQQSYTLNTLCSYSYYVGPTDIDSSYFSLSLYLVKAYYITSPVSISGYPYVGETLTANFSQSDLPNGSYKYEWYRGDTLAGSSTSNIYTLTSSDVSNTIYVKVVPNYDSGYKVQKAVSSSRTASISNKSNVSINENSQTYTYNSQPKTFTISGNDSGLGGFGVQYYVNGSWTSDAPTNAGSYNVNITRNSDSNHKAYSKIITNGLVINKVTPSLTSPTAKTNLIYNGTDQVLINEASANYGTIEYAVGDISGSNLVWSTNIPKMVSAGSCYVYYRVTGNDNVNNITEDKIQVTIGKKDLSITINNQVISYGSSIVSSINEVSSSGLISGDTLSSITLYTNDTNVTTAGVINANTSSVLITSSSVSKTDNYNIVITPGNLTITIKEINEPTVLGTYIYNGSDQTVFLNNTNTNISTTSSLTQKNAGEYTIEYTLNDPTNYTWATGSDGKVTWVIEKMVIDYQTNSPTYNGEEITYEYSESVKQYVSIEGDVKGTNVGKYTITVSLIDTNNTIWIDNTNTPKNLEWEIQPATISNKCISWGENEFIFNGEEQLPKATLLRTYQIGFGMFASEVVAVFGEDVCNFIVTGAKTDVGIYTATITGVDNSNYTLGDGNWTKPFRIDKKTIEFNVVDVATGTYEYDGTQKYTTCEYTELAGTDEVEYTLNYSDNINAGNCSVTITSATITKGTASNYNLIYTDTGLIVIDKKKVNEPTLTCDSFSFDNNEKEVEINNVESFMTISNTSITKATSKGVYTITYTLGSNYEWNTGSDGVIEWTIGPAITIITVDKTPIILAYGDIINIPISESNFGEVIITTNTSKSIVNNQITDKVSVGSYTITYKVNGTEDYLEKIETISLTINPKKIVVPTATQNLVYNGGEQTGVQIPDNALYTIVDNKKTNAGSYTAVVSLNDKSNYVWNLDTPISDDQNISWSISKKEVDVSYVTDDFTYNGSSQKNSLVATYTNVNEETKNLKVIVVLIASLHKAGNVDFKEALTYDIGFAFETEDELTNYAIKDEASQNNVTKQYTIKKAKVNKPTAKQNLVYNGNEQTGVQIPDNALYTIVDNIKTNAGSYTAVVSLNDKSNYEWSINTPSSDDQNINWSIAKKEVNAPTLTVSSFVYDNSEKEVEINGVLSCMTMSTDSVTKAKDKGTYIIEYSLDDNHCWKSNFNGQLTWSIIKAYATIEVSQALIELTYGDIINIPVPSTNLGEVIISTDTDKTITDNKITDNVNVGTYTITYKVMDTSNYDGDTKTVTIKINPKPVLINWCEDVFVYNATEQVVTATYEDIDGNIVPLKVTIDGNKKFINSGTYTAIASFNNENNYSLPSIKSKQYSITGSSLIIENKEGSVSSIVEITTGLLITNTFASVTEIKNKVSKDLNKKVKNAFDNKKSEVIITFDIHLENNNQVEEIDGNKYKVTLNIPENLKGKTGYGIVYIDDLGNVERISASTDGNTITFETTHFSTWAIVADSEGLEWWAIVLIILGSLLVILVILFFVWKREFNKRIKEEEEMFKRKLRFLDKLCMPLYNLTNKNKEIDD